MTLAALAARTASTLARIDRLLALNEPPPLRSPAAAYSGVSSGSPWSDAGESVERWVGERIAGQRQQE